MPAGSTCSSPDGSHSAGPTPNSWNTKDRSGSSPRNNSPGGEKRGYTRNNLGHVHYGIGGAESRPEISRSAPPRTAALMRRAASSQNSSSSSAPTKKRPSSLAATPVVPEPVNGSNSN